MDLEKSHMGSFTWVAVPTIVDNFPVGGILAAARHSGDIYAAEISLHYIWLNPF